MRQREREEQHPECFTRRQQLDFHVAGGLTRAAPSYVVGIDYSIRFDGLF